MIGTLVMALALGGTTKHLPRDINGLSESPACVDGGVIRQSTSFFVCSVDTRSSTTPPATCSVGMTYFDTDAAAGSRYLLCTSANTWTGIDESGGGSYYQTVKDEGSALTQRAAIDFAGAGVTCADSGGVSVCTIPGGTTAHNTLSATHSDTVADSVVRGDIIIGNLTPKWVRLPIGTSGKALMSNGTDVSWGTYSHTLLSASHTDSVPDTLVRGDLMVTNSTPNWSRLPLGSSGKALVSNGTDPSWGTYSHNLLSASHTDSAVGSPTRGDIIVSNTTPNWTSLALGTTGKVLMSNGSDPAWTTPSWGSDTQMHFNDAGTTSGTVELAWNKTTKKLAMADAGLLDLSAINCSSTTEGLKLPQATDVSAATAEGQISWHTTTDGLFVGTGAATKRVDGKPTTITSPANSTVTSGVSATTVGGRFVFPGTTEYRLSYTMTCQANVVYGGGGGDCSFKITDAAASATICTSATTTSATATNIIDCGSMSSVPTDWTAFSWSLIPSGGATCSSAYGLTCVVD